MCDSVSPVLAPSLTTRSPGPARVRSMNERAPSAPTFAGSPVRTRLRGACGSKVQSGRATTVARAIGSGEGLDRAHHAVVLVQQDVAVVDPPAWEVEEPRPHRELAEGRDAGRVLVVAHR